MKVLEYSDLDKSGVEAQYRKVIGQLERDDLYSAEVKKLSPGDYYRARLDHCNRLIFTLRRYGGERYALILEVVRNHAYEQSRFLRGAHIDEDKVAPLDLKETAPEQLAPLAYVNPAATRFHVLDKVISFDEAQEAVFSLPSPLILIGSAGSGKTALTLERMKHIEGDVLYVTLSPFLATVVDHLTQVIADGAPPPHSEAHDAVHLVEQHHHTGEVEETQHLHDGAQEAKRGGGLEDFAYAELAQLGRGCINNCVTG